MSKNSYTQLTYEKINTLLELLKNINKIEWEAIKNFIDANLEKIEKMNIHYENFNKIRLELGLELNQLQIKKDNSNMRD